MDYLYVAGFENFPDYIDLMMKKKQDTIYFPNALSSWATGEISMWSALEDSNLQPSEVNIAADSVFKIIKKQQDPWVCGIWTHAF